MSLRQGTNIPRFIGSTRHISCGAAEILSEVFKDNTLELVLKSQPNDFLIYVYIPDNYVLEEITTDNAEAKDTKLNDDRAKRILIKPKKVSEISIKFEFGNKQ